MDFVIESVRWGGGGFPLPELTSAIPGFQTTRAAAPGLGGVGGVDLRHYRVNGRTYHVVFFSFLRLSRERVRLDASSKPIM